MMSTVRSHEHKQELAHKNISQARGRQLNKNEDKWMWCGEGIKDAIFRSEYIMHCHVNLYHAILRSEYIIA